MKPLISIAVLAIVLLALGWRLGASKPETTSGLLSTGIGEVIREETPVANLEETGTLRVQAKAIAEESHRIESYIEDSIRFVFWDAYNKAPVPGVSLHEPRDVLAGVSLWRTRQLAGLAKWTSGGDGVIRLQSHELPALAFEVHAAGFGPGWISGEEETDPDGRTITVNLTEACEWAGVIKDIPAGVSSSLTVHASATALELQAAWSPVKHLEFDEIHWRVRISPDGSFSVPELASGVRLSCWVEQDGARLNGLAIEARMFPGETRTIEWVFPLASKISGRYLDLDGHPMVNATILVMTPWPGQSAKRHLRGKKQLPCRE